MELLTAVVYLGVLITDLSCLTLMLRIFNQGIENISRLKENQIHCKIVQIFTMFSKTFPHDVSAE